MQPTKSVMCPVCGRSNRNQDQCTFCGASLQGVESLGMQTQGSAHPPPRGRPDADRTPGLGLPPSSSGPTPPWGGPYLAPKFAGFWIRTVAYLIDGFLILILLSVLVGVGIFGYLSGSESDTIGSFWYRTSETNWNFLNLVVFGLNMAYFTFFLGTRGQTPGKMICGLKVVRLDGSPITYVQAVVRTLGYYLNHLTLCIGFLWVAIDPRKQGLHDKIAGTFEIRVGLAEIRDGQLPPSYGQGEMR